MPAHIESEIKNDVKMMILVGVLWAGTPDLKRQYRKMMFSSNISASTLCSIEHIWIYHIEAKTYALYPVENGHV